MAIDSSFGNLIYRTSNRMYNTVLTYEQDVNYIADKLKDGYFASVLTGRDFTDFCSSITVIPTISPYLYARSMKIDGVDVQDQDLVFGNLSWGLKEGITVRNAGRNMFYLGQYFASIDDKYYNYEPYRTCEIYIPFLGWIDFPMKYIIRYRLSFWLQVDYSTGIGTYYICGTDSQLPTDIPSVIDSDESTERAEYWDGIFSKLTLLSQYNCQIGYSMPITATNANDIWRNIMIGAAKIGVGAVTGSIGISASGVTDIATTETFTTSPIKETITEKAINPETNRLRTTESLSSIKEGGDVTRTRHTVYSRNTTPKVMSVVNDSLQSSLNIVASSTFKTQQDRGATAITSSAGSNKIIIKYTKLKMVPINTACDRLIGRPKGRYDNVYKYAGFTKISNIRPTSLDGITTEELSMLNTIVMNGIVFDEPIGTFTVTILGPEDEGFEIPYSFDNNEFKRVSGYDIPFPDTVTFNDDGYAYFTIPDGVPRRYELYLNNSRTVRMKINNWSTNGNITFYAKRIYP